MFGILRNAAAGNIDVVTAVVLVGEDDVDRLGPFPLCRVFIVFQLAEIIVIDDGDIADAFEYRLDLAAISDAVSARL